MTNKTQEWDYIFTDIKPQDKDYIYMTNLSSNVLVHKKRINSYIEDGYKEGYCKHYTHCRKENTYE